MNWPEIKEALVRRWPEKFGLYLDGELWIPCNEEMRFPMHISEHADLTRISAICEATGAVVWSVPNHLNELAWYGGYDLPEYIRHTLCTFTTREAAELAALGEWLRATEEQK